MQNPSSSLSACPDHARLLDLAEGRLADLDAETITLHIAECADCDQRLDRLEEQSDLLIQALAGMPATGEDEKQFQQLQQRLLDNPEPFSTRSESLTATALRDFASDDTLAPIESTLPFELGNYQLLELIGAGAHGAVFHARHLRLDREVAVKLLLRARGSYLAEFLNEMRIIGQLDHPHIVRATDAGEIDGIYFLAMDYVPGIDVTSLLRRTGPLSVADACEIARQTALGLACAHEHNLVHRDVKTSNLLFASSGVVKLLDLGLATVPVDSPTQASTTTETSPTASTLNGPRGTADYMPPEQWTASNLVTDKADLYSLGCTLFKLLTGDPPFKELPLGVSSKQLAHETLAPPVLSSLRSDVPRGLDRLLHQLLAKSADERPISASFVAKQLLRFADSADLAKLVRSHCPELAPLPTPPHIRPNTMQSRIRRVASRVPRRTWLTGATLLTLATAFGLRSRRVDDHEPLNTDSWRDLLAFQLGSVKINDALPRPELSREQDGSVQLQSESLALQHLGSPLVRPYRWQTTLRRKYPDSASQNRHGRHAGVFFGLQKADSDNLRFHTFELWRAAENWRLLWCEYAQPDRIEAPLDLAETVISGFDPSESLLFEVSVGKSGFPEFSFGGKRLPLSKWNLATEARNLISNNSRELVSLYAGRIGVIHHHGITTTESSRLLYLQN